MFDKYKKIRIIGTCLLLVAFVIFVFTGVKFRSVKQYNDDAKKIADIQDRLHEEYNRQNSTDTDDSNEIESDGANEETKESELDKSDIEESEFEGDADNNIEKSDEINGQQDSNRVIDNSNKDSIGNDEANGSNNKALPQDDKKYIRVNVRVTAKALLWDDYNSKLPDAVKEKIPANGEIISTKYYYVEEGTTALNLLKMACNEEGVSLKASGGYVSDIAGITHKLLDGALGNGNNFSGWTYYVNNIFVNRGAAQYKLKDGDSMVWWYSGIQGDYAP